MKKGKNSPSSKKGEIIRKIIDNALIIILIILVIQAQIKGKYIDKEIKIIETCEGKITKGEDLKWMETNKIIKPKLNMSITAERIPVNIT